MKKNKNLLVAVLVMILMLVLAGCSKSSGTDPAPADDTNKIENTTNTNTGDVVTDNNVAPDNTVDDNNTVDTSETDNNTDTQTAEGDFTFMNFIGCWLSTDENVHITLVIDSLHNWQACTKDEIFCTGTATPEYGWLYLYTSDGAYYCSLMYTDKAVEDEYGNVYVFDGPVEEYVPSGFVEVQSPAEAYDEEIAYMIQPGRYYRVDDDLDDSYIEITEDLEYAMYGTVDWSDGTDDGELPIGLIDEGYINTTDELGKYIVYPTLYIDQDPAEIFVSEDGLLHWGGYDYPDISVWEHGSDPAEN